jgi:quercetin dioxygenase-like cupin family protein
MNALRWLTAPAAALLVVAGAPAIASATPGIGIEAQTLSQATVNGHDYVTRQITIAPGGSTGWHWHSGRVFGVIRQGTLTHDVADCSVDGSYPAGAPITEGSGPDDVHIGRNLGSDPVVMWVLYIDVAGDPLANGVPNPGCPFE